MSALAVAMDTLVCYNVDTEWPRQSVNSPGPGQYGQGRAVAGAFRGETPVTSAMERRIAEEARSWCGTRFHHGSRIRGVGVDCVNLVVAILEAVGLIARQELPSYSPDWMLHHGREILLEGIARVADPIEPPFEVGDILTYKFGRAASHCGLYIGEGRVVHAATRDQVRCDLIATASLTRRFVAAYRLRRSG